MLMFTLMVALHLLLVETKSDCSTGGNSCSRCLEIPSCYWCGSATAEPCRKYYGGEIAQNECFDDWYQGNCPIDRNNEAKKKLDQMLDILSGLKKSSSEKNEYAALSSEQTEDAPNPLDNLFPQIEEKKEKSNADLKELLHKLLLLKLLKKVKIGDSTLTDEDKLLLSKLTGRIAKATTTKAPLTADVNNELSELLALLNHEKATKGTTVATISSMQKEIKTTIITRTSKSVSTKPTPQATTKIATIPNHVEEVAINYEEHNIETLPAVTAKTTANITTTTKAEESEENTSYCGLYEETSYCNLDHNCTWCNTLDNCIQRVDKDYQKCVENKEKVLDQEYGLDRCLASKGCKQCVEASKCYWCDVSKSCHTYPFFGYVPDSCGGDWYYKQCDVQLAVVIIVLPLIIILLAMVTFYFCLKYCYYKRKVLRVPLFERPGVFDYRKDKKVYFVNPEDEGSDDDLATENMRKKYRLPVERAPLIDPNS